MDVGTAISGRRSVREYTGEPVDAGVIRALIESATKAPSAVNEQPWAFTVVRDRQALDRVSAGAKAHMLATLGDDERADHFRSRLSNPDFHVFYHAPLLIVISAVSRGEWVVEDCALAAENLMLAAYAAGLGSCWIGFAQSYLNTPEGKMVLGLPAEWVAVAPIILGHPKSPPAPVPRAAPEIRWVG